MRKTGKGYTFRFAPPKSKSAHGTARGSAAARRTAGHLGGPGRASQALRPDPGSPGRLGAARGRESPDSEKGGRPPWDNRAAPLRSAAGAESGLRPGSPRLPTPGRSTSCPDPWRSTGTHLLPRQTRLPQPGPRQGSGNPRGWCKVSRGDAKTLPRDQNPQTPSPCAHSAPRLRMLAVPAQPPTCFAARPGLSRPVAVLSSGA